MKVEVQVCRTYQEPNASGVEVFTKEFEVKTQAEAVLRMREFEKLNDCQVGSYKILED